MGWANSQLEPSQIFTLVCGLRAGFTELEAPSGKHPEPLVEGSMAQLVRQAALKPESAGLYPYLPARIWTSAARLADLVASYRRISVEASDRAHRVLSGAHFIFRDLMCLSCQ